MKCNERHSKNDLTSQPLSSSSLSKLQSSTGLFSQCVYSSETTFATISSMFIVGGFFGALCGGPFLSISGHLNAMRATAVLYIVGSIIESLAGSAFVLSLGRLISGLGAGASTVVPLYISEISPSACQGLFGGMTQVAINLGILATQVLGFFLSHGNTWRWILAIGACFGGLQFFAVFALPESPIWLAARGHTADAKAIWQQIHGLTRSICSAVAETNDDSGTQNFAEAENLLAEQVDGEALPSETALMHTEPIHLSCIEAIHLDTHRPAIIAVTGVMLAQQLCGINSVVMYSVSLFANILPFTSALLMIFISIINLVLTITCSPLPDRLGFRTCLISIVGQGLSSLLLALSVFNMKVLSVVAIFLFVGCFAIGLGRWNFFRCAI